MNKLTIKSLLENLRNDIYNIPNTAFVNLRQDKITGIKKDMRNIHELAYINAHDIDILIQRYIDDLGNEFITNK